MRCVFHMQCWHNKWNSFIQSSFFVSMMQFSELLFELIYGFGSSMLFWLYALFVYLEKNSTAYVPLNNYPLSACIRLKLQCAPTKKNHCDKSKQEEENIEWISFRVTLSFIIRFVNQSATYSTVRLYKFDISHCSLYNIGLACLSIAAHLEHFYFITNDESWNTCAVHTPNLIFSTFKR